MGDQGSPDLVQYGILTGPVKGFNFQFSLDPLKKELDPPVPAAEFGYLRRMKALSSRDVE